MDGRPGGFQVSKYTLFPALPAGIFDRPVFHDTALAGDAGKP
jgi:hypothetical protein